MLSRRHRRSFDRIRALDPGTRWTDVESLRRALGAEVYEGSGSTVTFVLRNVKLTADRPHPGANAGAAW